MRHIFLIFLFIFLQDIVAEAQSVTAVKVDSIIIEGNRKTKRRYITRELTFQEGDTIPLSMMSGVLENNRLRLLNTTLFVSVKINVVEWKEDNHVNIKIICLENWFFYPIPIFELADRNFNVWWTEMKRDLRRTNYGFRLTYNNATGRRDPLSAQVQGGYTPRYSINYSRPYVNKKENLGFNFGYSYSVNREVGYDTDSNKIQFYSSKELLLQKRESAYLGFSYTPGLFASHSFSIGYNANEVDTAISERLNKDYYLDGKNKQKYFYFNYGSGVDKRDFRPYPQKGYLLVWGLTKNGLFPNDDVNTLEMSVRMAQYTKLSSKFSVENIMKVRVSPIRSRRPYTNNRGLGFGGDNIRGYELYVVDGYDLVYSKNSLRFSIIDKEFDWTSKTKKKWLKPWFLLPIKSFLTFNFDAGYVNNPYDKRITNPLNNRVIYGGGIGVDFLLWNNIYYRFEYSMNHLGEKGIFFNYSAGF
jgi:outer membrane protein assembly factor BamA